MAIQLGTSQTLIITIPSEGDLNWATSFRDDFAQVVSDHDHTGNGAGSKIKYAALVTETDVINGIDSAPAVRTDTIQDSAITTAKIADDAVTTSKIPDSGITTSKIADSNVTTSKIADDNVTTDKIADNAVTTSKVPNNAITYSKLSSELQENIDTVRDTKFEIYSSQDLSALPSTVRNAEIIIDVLGSQSISNINFIGCRISLDATVTFSSCSFQACTIAEADSVAYPYNINISGGYLYRTSIRGFENLNITDSSMGHVDLENSQTVNITTTGSKTFKLINVNNVQSLNLNGFMTIQKSSIKARSLTLEPTSTGQISLSTSSLIEVDNISSNSNFSTIDDTTSVICSSYSSGLLKLRDSSSVSIIDTTNHSEPFRYIDGKYSPYNNVFTRDTLSKGDVLVYNTTTQEWNAKQGVSRLLVSAFSDSITVTGTVNSSVFFNPLDIITNNSNGTWSNIYDPDSVIDSNYDVVIPEDGIYILSVIHSTGSAITKSIVVNVNSNSAYNFAVTSNYDDSICLSELALNLQQNDVLRVGVNHHSTGNTGWSQSYTLKQIL